MVQRVAALRPPLYTPTAAALFLESVADSTPELDNSGRESERTKETTLGGGSLGSRVDEERS